MDVMGSSFNDIAMSVYRISCSGSSSTGTGLVMRSDDVFVLITAAHIFKKDNVVPNDRSDVSFDIYDGNRKVCRSFSGVLIRAKCLYMGVCSDICAVVFRDFDLLCNVVIDDVCHNHHIRLGDDAFAFGFPFLFDSNSFSCTHYLDSGLILPSAMFRHGYVSGQCFDKGEEYILLDLYNNKGFSGSPVFLKVTGASSMTIQYVLIGVLSGFYNDKLDEKYENNVVDDVDKVSGEIEVKRSVLCENSHLAQVAPFHRLQFSLHLYLRGVQ